MNNLIKQINNQQQKDGGFCDSAGAASILYTSLILFCLNHCGLPTKLMPAENLADTEEINSIRKKAVNFLLSRKNSDWKFVENTAVNFFALAALAEYDKEIIDGSALAKILTALINIESQEGGPYYSQNGAGDINKVIEPTTNASIALFLSFFDVELPNLEQFCGIIKTPDMAIEAFGLALTPALSAAMSLEKYYQGIKLKEKNQELRENNFDVPEQEMMDKIVNAAKQRFSGLSSEFKDFAIKGIQEIIEGNQDKQMSLMAYYTKLALGKKAEKISDKMVAEMGLANIFFWKAFIIYDDFWDEDEAADPRILPTANLYARSYVDFFGSLLPASSGFNRFFHKLMDDLDEANTWETTHCRAKVDGSKFIIPDHLPDYGDYEFKYRPASGHILGPVAMFVQLGYGLDSPEVKNIISYFKNYLIAMQINDDSHDWEEDLRRGHISTVVAMLLKDFACPKKEIDLNSDLLELKKVFWFKTIIKAAQITITHTEKSRQALKSIVIIEDAAPLERLINITENVAKKAIKEQKDSVKFLQSYKN